MLALFFKALKADALLAAGNSCIAANSFDNGSKYACNTFLNDAFFQVLKFLPLSTVPQVPAPAYLLRIEDNVPALSVIPSINCALFSNEPSNPICDSLGALKALAIVSIGCLIGLVIPDAIILICSSKTTLTVQAGLSSTNGLK